MGCSYCYYRHNKADGNNNRMNYETLKSVISKSIKFNDDCANFIWHGGEPMLMGLDYFKDIIKIEKETLGAKNIEIVNCIQSNGTLINESWCRFFKENNFRVGLSIDGNYDIHSHGRGTTKEEFKSIENSIKLLKESDNEFSIICVVTDYSIGKEKEIFQYFINNGINSWAFLPMNYGDINDCLSPEKYGNFLVNMFNVWINSGKEGIKIREFDEYLRGFLGKDQVLCNHCNVCNCYLTITPSGDVYPCDAFPQNNVVKLGNINDNSVAELKENNNTLFEKSKDKPIFCDNCEFYSICNGGCRFYRWINSKDFSKEQFYCKSFYMLFKAMSKALSEL